jgi:hypothetical protein
MRNAVRRSSTTSATCVAARAPFLGAHAFRRSTAALLPGLTHPEVRLRTRFRGAGRRCVAGFSRRCLPRLQRAPRMPVIVPADMMSKAARERLANPSAGAVLARWPGMPPDHLLHVGEDFNVSHMETKVKELSQKNRQPAPMHRPSVSGRIAALRQSRRPVRLQKMRRMNQPGHRPGDE